MKTITYITGNQNKIKNAQNFLKKYDIKVEQESIETPEIQADDPEDVAIYSAQYAYKQLGKPLMKMDVGFHINCLNGFPGPYIKQINNWFKPEQILNLLEKEEDRSCYFKDVLCFISKNKTKCFIQQTKGKIAREVSGDNGWGIDKIFIPDGFNRTLASMTDTEGSEVWDQNYWKQLAKYLNKNL
jgi:non-canonical purine NTP pyrophosphatase (RdgB/HAM1 family)